MLTGWHVAHLPVRLTGKPRVWQRIHEVVVSWPELAIEGFLLTPRPFYAPFVPSRATFRLTGLGLELADAFQVVHKSWRWRRDVLRRNQAFMKRPVSDMSGHLYGRLNDVIFDEMTLKVTHLVVSRGILGDLLFGALIVPDAQISQVSPAAIKIHPPGAPFSMR